MIKYAVVFSGQGSERVGMLNDFIKESEMLKRTLSSLSAVVPDNIDKIIASSDSAVITKNNQILLLLFHKLMSDCIIEKIGYPPQLCMGHSFGQFSAIVRSGAVALSDMVTFVLARTKTINDPRIQVKAYFKSIHGITLEAFKTLYEEENLQGNIELALHNQAEQIVVAVTAEGELILKELAIKHNYMLKDINVSRPFHTHFMDEFNACLQPHIDALPFITANIPVLVNNSLALITNTEALKAESRIQMIVPVFWYESIIAASKQVDAFVIVDPSDTQFKIIKRIAHGKIHNVNNFGVLNMIEKRGL
ncbi:MAG: acyltransferase domain-containing protein [Coriobacteriales bacterium]|jgi:[acyl-carrier-protein] S-malonyltransferase|nr:acyltransferase domain-containing protein [Coriobacteriales bacterium]